MKTGDALDRLPEIVEDTMGGLQAGPAMKYKIMSAVREEKTNRRRFVTNKVLAAALSCCLVVVGGIWGWNAGRSTIVENKPMIVSLSAGVEHDESAVPAFANESARDLNQTKFSVKSGSIPAYQSLWEGSNGTYPMIVVNGKYYRMMTAPSAVSQKLLGRELGSVEVYTTDPALADGSKILSNKAVAGTAVYEIKNMGSTMVAAEVNGKLKAFQRVSFNGSSLRGSESLKDTLQLSGSISRIELSGVGTVNDSSICNKLYNKLVNSASYESSGSINNKQSLIITMDNGLTLQMLVKNDKLAACGVWSCPEFFEAFEAAVN